MTQPTRPPDRQFARDVAKQIDRRRVRRRVTVWSALLALIAAGAAYLRCGGGLGLGGGGLGLGGAGDAPAHQAAAPARCAIRVAAEGILVDSKPRSRDEAIAACRSAARVDIYPTGDVPHREPQALGAALRAAGARDVQIHEPPRPPEPSGEPAKR
jgi:hypothetical protein